VTDLKAGDDGAVLALFRLEGSGDQGVFSAPLDIVRQKVYQAAIQREGLKTSDLPRMLQWEHLRRGHLTLDFKSLGGVARYHADRKTR
jgi:hypothetical protein